MTKQEETALIRAVLRLTEIAHFGKSGIIGKKQINRDYKLLKNRLQALKETEDEDCYQEDVATDR